MITGIVPRTVASGFMMLLLFSTLFAQDKLPDKTPEKTEELAPKRKGLIKGKVMSDDGQPLEGANVSLNAMQQNGMGGWRQVQTDDEGNFVADGLASGLYNVSASSNAFVQSETPLDTKYYRLGESADFTLVKGGVITGRVTNALGEPVIGVQLRVERVSDLEGRKSETGGWFGQPRKTDDRGVYRVYGLPPGKYVVSVGGRPPYRSGPPTPYEADTPTFYPSATRDSATEVTVNLGEEVRGIDIRYRREKGHSISGRVTGGPQDNTDNGISVALLRYPGGGSEMSTYIRNTDSAKGFELFPVPDGEYELEAGIYGGDDKDGYKSARRRVTVKSGNVANIELRLLPLSSVEAKVEWEVPPEKDRKAECQNLRPPLPEETMLWLSKDDPKINSGSSNARFGPALLNDKNELKYQLLDPATYRFIPRALDEAWYIKTITANEPAPDDPKSKTQSPKSLDFGKQGLALKPGEKRKDVVLTLANGAASLRGRVVADKEQPLPSRLRVHLIPAEKEAAEDLLRYAEQKTKDGTFMFTNLAPGKYWLLARKVAEDEPDTRRPNPLAWDPVTRKALRTEAEAAQQSIELKFCQRVNDVVLRLSRGK